MSTTNQRHQVSIEADPTLPIIRITRDFDATPAQLMRAHTDPELFARWVGPNGMATKILDWDATTGGRWRYVAGRDGEDYSFHGCFHEVGEDRIVQTFTFDGQHYAQTEDFYFCRVDSGAVVTTGWTELERRAMTAHRWWTVDDLATTGDVVYPENLGPLLARLLAATDDRDRLEG